MITSDRNSGIKAWLNITTEEETCCPHVPISKGEPELNTMHYPPPVAFDYPVSFLAASSLLIYRIIHQTLLQEMLSDRLLLRRPDHRKRPQTHKRGQVSSEHIDGLKGKYECYSANMHRTSLPPPFLETNSHRYSVLCCEITQPLSAGSNSHAQTQRQPQVTCTKEYLAHQPRRI